MRYRKLGTSDLQVPVISFGAWALGGWLWGGAEDTDSIRAIQAGIDAGITCVDTAPMYGLGHSETIVGKAIAGRRDQVIVATKCGLRWDLAEGCDSFEREYDGKRIEVFRNLRPHSIKTECERSLKRLGVETIDLYQCHWSDASTPIDDTMNALLDLKEQGKIRWIGVSNFAIHQLEAALACGEVVSDQPPYSAIRRDAEMEVLPFCASHSLGTLVYTPMAQGLLTGKMTPDREIPEGDLRCGHAWFNKENRERIQAMLTQVMPIAEAHGATLAQIYLAWTVTQPGVTTALAGARNEAQARENARAGDILLSGEECQSIRRLAEALVLA